MVFKRKDYDRLTSRIDIVEIISKYIELKPRARGKGKTDEYIGLCPFHKEETPSFSVTSRKQFYHCFGCGTSGSAITFLQKFCGLSGGKALVQAAEMTGITVPQGPSKPSSKKVRDRKKYKRKMTHKREVVWRRKNQERQASRQEKPAKLVIFNSFNSTQDEDIPF